VLAAVLHGNFKLAGGRLAKATMLDALSRIGLDTLDGRFYFASELGQASMVDKMLKNGGVNINKRSSDGSTPLLIAARRGHTTTVIRLLKVQDIEINCQWVGNTACTTLMLAAENGDKAVVDRLLALEVKVDVRDEFGGTALYGAASHNKVAVVRQLLQAKAAPNIRRFRDNATPFLVAAQNGHVDVVRSLSFSLSATCSKSKRISAVVIFNNQLLQTSHTHTNRFKFSRTLVHARPIHWLTGLLRCT